MPEFRFFHKTFDRKYPISEMIDPSRIEQINWGEEELYLNLTGEKFPLTSVESFLLVKGLLKFSINAGQWMSMELPEDTVLHFESRDLFGSGEIGMTSYGTEFETAARSLLLNGYLKIARIAGRKYIAPTESLIQFYYDLTKDLRED